MDKYYMSIQKVFEFKHESGKSVFLHGPDRLQDSDCLRILNEYVFWYNTEFIINEEDCPEISAEDFRFVRSFQPIDFYEELKC